MKKLNKQKDCNTCDGKGYKFFTNKEMDKIYLAGYDMLNISNTCPDCYNKSYKGGGVFPRI